MTGFSLIQKKTSEANYEISVRAVNGRFLEPRFHMPRETIHLEPIFRKKLQQVFKRGTIDIFINRKFIEGQTAKVSYNSALAKQYLAALKKASKELHLECSLHLENVVRFPEVFTLDSTVGPNTKEDHILETMFDQAIKKCDLEKEREGLALKKHLQKLIQNLEQSMTHISENRVAANKEIAERYQTRMAARLEGKEIEPHRLAQEVAIMLEKGDINEEIQRLSEHLRNFKALLNLKHVEGKKLDFYTQELLREVNTIGSKSQIARITTSVIEAKSVIEKIREQVQNIE